MQTYPVARPEPDLSVGHLFSRGWETFKANFWLSLGIAVLYLVLTSLGSGGAGHGGFSGFLNLVGFVIAGPLTAGVYNVYLRMARGESVEFASMFDGFKQMGKSVGVYWLMLLATIVGFVLLVVPGIVLGLGLLPAMFLVLDGNLGVMDTLKRSWEMTNGYKWQLFLVALAVVGINILGLVALVIGVFITMTVTMLIFAAAYDELAGAKAVPVARPAYPPPSGFGPRA